MQNNCIMLANYSSILKIRLITLILFAFCVINCQVIKNIAIKKSVFY